MPNQDQKLDKILHALGPRGRFTRIQLVIAWTASLPTAFQLLSNVFIGSAVPHNCASPSNETSFINSYPDLTNVQNVSVSYKQCEIHILSRDTIIKKEKCLFGMEYELPVESSFRSQFDLVCDSTNLARLTQTLVIGGQAFGALLAALLSDRLGRKPVVIAGNLGLLVSGIAIAYSTNYVMFTVFKFMVGGFQQAVVTAMINIGVEIMISKDRRIIQSIGGVVWASSVMLMSPISYLLRNHSWRTLQLVLSLSSIPVVFQILFLKESLRWLLANGKTREASNYIKTAARMNGKSEEDIIQALEMVVTNDMEIDVPPTNNAAAPTQSEECSDVIERPMPSRKMTYLDIFKQPRLFLNTAVLWVGWFTTAFGFFAIYLESTTLSGNRFVNFCLTALMEVPSNIFFYFGLNRFGRKPVLVCMFAILSVGIIGSGICRSLEDTKLHSGLSIAFNMVAMVGASGCFGGLFFYTPELFPTNIRNQSLGISSLMARIGGMLAPFTAILSDQAKWGPGALIGGLACIIAIMIRFLPETNGRELPQTLEEMLTWFKKRKTVKGKDGAGAVLLNDKGERTTTKQNTTNGSNSII